MKILALLSLFFSITATVRSADVLTTTIPIDYKGIHASLEMSSRWADSQFGFHRVPADVEERLKDGGDFVICRKDLTWSRSFFRGPLGIMTVDVTITRLPKELTVHSTNHPTLEQLRIVNAKADFRYPKELHDYYKLSIVESMTKREHTITYFEIGGVKWVRLNRIGNDWKGVPQSEILVLGLDSRTYLRIDLGVSREDAGPKGEAWAKAALYWQNKIIESIRVTGLKQILTGDEKSEPWRFPDSLEYAPELLKK